MRELFELRKAYGRLKSQIVRRLSDFGRLKSADADGLFEELCFCLLTPQSKAEICFKIVSDLKDRGLLRCGSHASIRPFLKRARFYRKKADYVVGARRIFLEGADAMDRVKNRPGHEARQWLAAHIKGLGYKEASHFLRNIGRGEDLAILDIHVLRRLKKLGVISRLPGSLSPHRYLRIEKKMRLFASRVGIPMAHLDLLFWSMGTGKILK